MVVPEQAAPQVAQFALGAAWRRHRVPLLVLWGLALLAYANSFRAGLIFDNYYAIGQDPRLRQATAANARLILNQSYWYQTGVSSLYRPLTTLSYLFNYSILGNGASPAGYHWVNFALHAGNIALVYLLGLLLLEESWPAFAMAAIWAVHPVLTESVTNIVGRADLLAAFGVLAGLLCYARSVAGGGRATGWRCALAVATTVGMFSKESAVTVIAVVFLYDIAFCRGVPLRSRLWGYLAMFLPVAAYLWLRSSVLAKLPVGHPAFTDNPLWGADFWTARLTACKVLGKYFCLLVWPGHLSADYSYNQIPLFTWRLDNSEDWKTILGLLICAGAVAAAVFCYRRSKPVFFFIGFFFVTLAPTANLSILIGTIMAERFLYLPAIGFAGCLAWLGWAGYQRFSAPWPAARMAAPAVLGVVCLALCGRTFARNADWFDEQSLWSGAARVSPASYKAHQHLALIALDRPGGWQVARGEIDRAVAILEPLPDEQKVPAIYATAGFCDRQQGDALGPNGGDAWYRKSLEVLLEGQRADQAVSRALVRQNNQRGFILSVSGEAAVYMELGRTYVQLGEFQKALEAFEYGRRFKPSADFFAEIASTYRAMGDPASAEVTLLEGIAMNVGDQRRLAAGVVDLYRKADAQSCALSGAGDAAAVNFNCPLVHDQLCAASKNGAVLYHLMHRDSEAGSVATGAIQSLGCPAEMFR